MKQFIQVAQISKLPQVSERKNEELAQFYEAEQEQTAELNTKLTEATSEKEESSASFLDAIKQHTANLACLSEEIDALKSEKEELEAAMEEIKYGIFV